MISTAYCVPARGLASQSRLPSSRPPFKTMPRRRYTAASAQEGSEEGVPTRPSDPDLGALESTLRRRKKGVKRAQASQPTEEEVSPRRNIDEGPVRAKWREGALLPDGWDRMDIFQKIYELYIGERGLLFWINKLAYASIFVLAFAWVLFRFVGPGIGLYTLKSDFSLPPGL